MFRLHPTRPIVAIAAAIAIVSASQIVGIGAASAETSSDSSSTSTSTSSTSTSTSTSTSSTNSTSSSDSSSTTSASWAASVKVIGHKVKVTLDNRKWNKDSHYFLYVHAKGKRVVFTEGVVKAGELYRPPVGKLPKGSTVRLVFHANGFKGKVG